MARHYALRRNGGRIISTYVKQTVTVKWELRNNRSEVLRDGGEVEITVPAMDTVWLDTVELPEANCSPTTCTMRATRTAR